MRKLLGVPIVILLSSCATTKPDPKYAMCSRPTMQGTIFAKTTQSQAYYDCVKRQKEKEWAAAEDLRKRQIDPNYVENERKQAEAEEKARLAWEANAKAASAFGTPKEVYFKYYGQPDEKELVDGNDRYWYDDADRPRFVVFKNDKLNSIIVDRETINRRRDDERYAEESRERSRARAEDLAYRRRQEWAQAMQGIANSIERNRPAPVQIRQPTQTNCTKIGNDLRCTTY